MDKSTSPDNQTDAAAPDTSAPDQPADAPAPTTPPTPTNMQKAGEHVLTNGELALFGEIYASFERLRQLVAMYLCDKHGYPEKEPVAFEFNFANRTVTAFRPSKIEVAKDLPSNAQTSPTPNKTN